MRFRYAFRAGILTIYYLIHPNWRGIEHTNRSYFSIDNLQNITSGVILDALSGHLITFSSLNFNLKKKNKVFGEVRSFNVESKANFKAALSNQSWEDVLESNCPNIAFNNFSEKYLMLFNLHFPKRRVKINKNIQPINSFMTPGWLISRKVKLKLARKAKSHPVFLIYKIALTCVISITKQLMLEKKNYLKNKIYEAGKNSKMVWNVINEATNPAQKNKNFLYFVQQGPITHLWM